jgi:hypothetical protein
LNYDFKNVFKKFKKFQYFPANKPKSPGWPTIHPPHCGWWNHCCHGHGHCEHGGQWQEKKDEKGFVIFFKFRFVPYAMAGPLALPLDHLFGQGRFDTARSLFAPLIGRGHFGTFLA